MAHAYTPGLRVTEKTIIRKKRVLPIPGEVLVKEGDAVDASTVVAKTDLPGKVRTINIVNALGIIPEEIREYMLKGEGDPVEKDEPIAENKPFLKWFKTQVKSPITGTVENISEVTGQIIMRESPEPLKLLAYVDGRVIEVIGREGVVVETVAAFVQGIFGVGGETVGPLAMAVSDPEEVLTPDRITEAHRGKIVVGGSFVESAAFGQAQKMGVRGIVVGGFHDKSLKDLLGYDLGVAITGTEQIAFTLILTEGFGKIAMARKTFDLLASKEGQKTSISGATQIRAGVIRPEIVIPDPSLKAEDVATTEQWEREAMQEGDPIRVIREPYFGRIGEISALPSELQQIASGSRARVLEVAFPDGETVTVPRANVEIIES
ncbi:MAG: hypothetical protein DRP97_02890 [Candidatus Latescibacterota bacterium]|nr:MAG: hypothetical protein DRP97_02890 [Candidatus Latescibacterota bacterium]